MFKRLLIKILHAYCIHLKTIIIVNEEYEQKVRWVVKISQWGSVIIMRSSMHNLINNKWLTTGGKDTIDHIPERLTPQMTKIRSAFILAQLPNGIHRTVSSYPKHPPERMQHLHCDSCGRELSTCSEGTAICSSMMYWSVATCNYCCISLCLC